MIDTKKQEELFRFIGEKLNKKIECYVIGGSAMMYYGMKDATKDIDLVFEKEKDMEEIVRLLKSLGYKEKETKILYPKKKNVPVLLERDARFDLFSEKIVNTVLSDAMKERINAVYEYNNLIVKVISPEDLIITKCATERAGDRKDALEIIKKTNVNWDVIIKESINQTELSPYLFPLFLFDFLYELKEDLKADIPKEVLDKIRKISEKMLEKEYKKTKK